MCINIPILQALKDVPIFNKYIKEECIIRLGRRRKDTPTINFIGQLADRMLGKLIVPKYLDPRSPLVSVHINNTLVQNTIIDLGFEINIMTRDTMMKLNLQGFLRDTPTVLQLADRSKVKLKFMLEDIMIFIDSWECPTDFPVLQTNSHSNVYPLIWKGLGWLQQMHKLDIE